jgi:hypothetical protein
LEPGNICNPLYKVVALDVCQDDNTEKP